MAIFNEILEGRFNRALQKLFAIKSNAPVRQLGGEIMPVFSVFNGVENRFLEGWNLFAQSTTQAAGGAGVPSSVRLRNPVTSNVVAVVTRISVHIGVVVDNAVVLYGGRQPADQGGPIAAVMVDPRSGVTAKSNCIVSQANTVGGSAFGTAMLQRSFTAVVGAGSHQPDQEYIAKDEDLLPLLPGDAYQVETTAANANVLVVGWWWRERPMTESERQ